MKKGVDTNAELAELRKIPSNKKCFDCVQAGTTYAVPELGIFLCSICGGIHREFNHRVKGLSTCNFTEVEVSKLKSLGNEKASLIWMANHNPQLNPIPEIKDSNRLKEFLRLKYLEKRFYQAQPVPQEKPIEVKPAEKKLEKSLTGGFMNLIDDDNEVSVTNDRRQSEVRRPEPNLFQASFPNGTFQSQKGKPDPNVPSVGVYQPGPSGYNPNQGVFNPGNSLFAGQPVGTTNNPNVGALYTGQPNPGMLSSNLGPGYIGQQPMPMNNNPNLNNVYPGQTNPNFNPSNPYTAQPAQVLNPTNNYPPQPISGSVPQNFNPFPSQPPNSINFNQFTNQPQPHYPPPVYNNSNKTPPGIHNPGFSATAGQYPGYPSNFNQYSPNPSGMSPGMVGGGQQVFFKSSDPFEQLIEEEKQRKFIQTASRNQMTPQQNLLFQQFSVQTQMYEKNYGVQYPYSFQQWLTMNSTQDSRPNTKNPFDRF